MSNILDGLKHGDNDLESAAWMLAIASAAQHSKSLLVSTDTKGSSCQSEDAKEFIYTDSADLLNYFQEYKCKIELDCGVQSLEK